MITVLVRRYINSTLPTLYYSVKLPWQSDTLPLLLTSSPATPSPYAFYPLAIVEFSHH